MGHKKHHSYTEREERHGKRVFMMLCVAAVAIAMLIVILFDLVP